MFNFKPLARLRGWRTAALAAAVVLAAGLHGGAASAADYKLLPVVKPVISCADLGQADVSSAVDGKVTISSAKLISTPKGQFCTVSGNIEPTIGFVVDLPVDNWT